MGFHPTKLNGIEYSGWKRDAVKIQKLVSLEDISAWSAMMTSNNKVVIQGPPFDALYLSTLDSYHRDDIDSEESKEHMRLKEAIESDPSCQVAYYELDFGNMFFDNVIFSGDPVHVKMETKGVVKKIGNHEVKAMFVSWTLAIHQPRVKVVATQKADLDAAFV